MAIKTFTTGEVLTAADTNTYLANSGLVYITSGTFSQADCKVQGCFSATYDNYRLVISNFTTSGGNRATAFQLLQGATALGNNYNFGGFYCTYGAANGTVTGSAQAYWQTFSTAASTDSGGTIEIQRPFISDQTTYQLLGTNYDAYYAQAGNNTNVASCDGFRITNLSSDTNAFSYAVYGYRKA
jgi:hypothetical protein